MTLLRTRKSRPWHQKSAAIGGKPDQGLEKAFASLAWGYLRDKAPRLLDFADAFQVIDRSDDNERAAGVFGFKVGNMRLFGPVFFIKGDLKGHELLFVKDQDQFVPMKENWVNFLLSRRPHMLGEPSQRDVWQQGALPPDFRSMSQFPRGKYAAAGLTVDDSVLPFLPCMAAARTNAFDVQMPSIDLGEFLHSRGLAKTAYDTLYCRYPLLKKAFDRFYGADFFPGLMAKQAEASLARSLLPAKQAESWLLPPKRKSFDDLFNRDKKDKKADLQIYVHGADALRRDIDTLPSWLRDRVYDAVTDIGPAKSAGEDVELRRRLLDQPFAVVDKRAADAASTMYEDSQGASLTNPSADGSGVYDMFDKSGVFDTVAVIVGPIGHLPAYSGEAGCVVIRQEPAGWLTTYPGNVWVRQSGEMDPRKRWAKWFEGLSSASPSPGGMYAAVGPDGRGTLPFEVEQSHGEGVYGVAWASTRSRNGVPPQHPPHMRWDHVSSPYDAVIRMTGEPGSAPYKGRNDLRLPKDWKLVSLREPSKPPTGPVTGSEPIQPQDHGESDRPVCPGSLTDVERLLQEKMGSIDLIHLGGGEIGLEGARLGKAATLVTLVAGYGASEPVAQAMLQRVLNGRQGDSVHFKVAYAPAFPAPDYGSEPGIRTPHRLQYPQESLLGVPGLEAGMVNPYNDPFFRPDPNAVQMAQRAAQGGHREFFDVGVLSSMLKAVRQDSLVDRYLGDLMKALNVLGRLLFTYYWHTEEFENRYGKHDLPELEDTLRNAFEVLGDLTLYLKEKTVSPMDGAGVGPDSGPDIEQASRD